MSSVLDTIVIGGGQAGMAAAYHLRRAGLRFVILEAGAEPGGSWPRYYDSLTLFSPARYSGLPGLAFSGDPDRYPQRDEVIAYLRDYAAYFELPIITRAKVQGVSRSTDQSGFDDFVLQTTSGQEYRARALIAATGSFHTPRMPRLPGQELFAGRILHAADYRNPRSFAGQRVIVVGAANSAVQIAVELASAGQSNGQMAAAARVTLATREPVRFVPQRLLGRDFHWWMKWTGLDYLPWLRDQSTPVLDGGVYRRSLAEERPERRPMFQRFTPRGVAWTETDEEAVDAVIFATGYQANLPYLAGLGALADDGTPRQRKGISSIVPGLYFVGLSGQRSFRSATLRGVGPDAAHVVRAARRYLKSRKGS